MLLNFPQEVSLAVLAADLARVGWAISNRRNPDGSHNVVPLPVPDSESLPDNFRHQQERLLRR